jgi:hypothetical protein
MGYNYLTRKQDWGLFKRGLVNVTSAGISLTVATTLGLGCLALSYLFYSYAFSWISGAAVWLWRTAGF